MWTLAVKKSDGTVHGYMSTETTRKNLGDYPEADFDIYEVPDQIAKGVSVGSTVDISGGQIIKVTALIKTDPNAAWKAKYAAAKADSERIAIIAQKLGLI